MLFRNESDLELYLRKLILARITTRHLNIHLLCSQKVVDIVIYRDGEKPAVFFLEAKLFAPQNNRIGIGSRHGEGFQPEIIRRQPEYFETHLRWVIADSRVALPSFLFVPTNVVKEYLAGGSIGGRQNNIQTRIFDKVKPFTEEELVDRLSHWILA